MIKRRDHRDISSRFSQRDRSTGNDPNFHRKKLLVLNPFRLSFAVFSDRFSFFYLVRIANIVNDDPALNKYQV